MGDFMDVDALLAQLEADMKQTGRGAFRPHEVPGLVRAAAAKVLKAGRKYRFPIGKLSESHTNAIAGESPQRGARMPSGDRVMDRTTGADRSDLRA